MVWFNLLNFELGTWLSTATKIAVFSLGWQIPKIAKPALTMYWVRNNDADAISQILQ
jgi:hypothetical protein